ncbi:MAG: beta-ketoacyl-ACP synthase III [Bacillota bacterium]
MAHHPAGIIGLGVAIPEHRLTNAELETMVDTSDEWIVNRTGIRERPIAPPETATSDLATQAAARALADAGLTPADLDLIIVSTVTPDMAFPATACLVQARLGATCPAFDLEAACTGFIYGLSVAQQFINTGTYRHVLVIGAETLSRITDYQHRGTCILFGDGAGAAVVGRVSSRYGFLSTSLGADGSGADVLKQPAGGSRLPASAETVAARQHYIQMDGSEVFKFAVRIMTDATEAVLAGCGAKVADIDLVVPHQANARIVDAAAKRLGLKAEQLIVNIDRFGNISSASIPIALEEAYRTGRIRQGHLVVLVGFGAGLTWGSMAIRWSKDRALSRSEAAC